MRVVIPPLPLSPESDYDRRLQWWLQQSVANIIPLAIEQSGGGGGSGTVTSVDVTSTTAAITASGGPVTTSGAISLTANQFTASTPGVVPASGGGTTNFLRADGTWAAAGGGSGTVTSVAVASGNAALSVSGSPITGSGTITVTANAFTSTDPGVVPASGGDPVQFLAADGAWKDPAAIARGLVFAQSLNNNGIF